MMRLACIALATSVTIGSEAYADTVFAVLPEDIDLCSTLSDFNAELSERRNAGWTRQELSSVIPESISTEVQADLLNILFSLEAGNPGFAAKVTGALCLLERLKPLEIN